MRPRVFPAEDKRKSRRTAVGQAGFNEAAGIPRGRLGIVEQGSVRKTPLQ